MLEGADGLRFSAELPADPDHAAAIREEAIDWLESRFEVGHVFRASEVLALAGERERRWLVSRLRSHGLIPSDDLGIAEVADALAVLNLRARGVKFRDAIDAVLAGTAGAGTATPRYGGVWNRLAVVAQDSVRRLLPARLLAAALAALLDDPIDRVNALVIVRSAPRSDDRRATAEEPVSLDHDAVYSALARRLPSVCAVSTPAGELLVFDAGQTPSRSELTSRHFVRLRLVTDRAEHEVILGCLRPPILRSSAASRAFVGRILDFVSLDVAHFTDQVTRLRIEVGADPAVPVEDDLRLWVLTQMISSAYPGSLCEVAGLSTDTEAPRVLASSASRPWEPAAISSPRRLEMLSDYAGRVGIPLIVERVVSPFRELINSAEAELRYLGSMAESAEFANEPATAIALPIVTSSGDPIAALYLLSPGIDAHRIPVEVRLLTTFAHLIGEVIERQRASRFSSELLANAASSSVLEEGGFREELIDLLGSVASEAQERLGHGRADLRLPFLLLSAYRPEPDELDPALGAELAHWLERTMRHLDWRSFVRGRLAETSMSRPVSGFMGELPGIGMVVTLDRLTTKDELDQIRSAFPASINHLAPANSPVRLLAWVLDVPASRIAEAGATNTLAELSGQIERWASDVASVLRDVVESSTLAHDEGDWEGALRSVRRALQRPGGQANTYLHRIGAECAFSLGDWPSALDFAERAVELSRQDPGSGGTRSLCQAGDASLLLLDPGRAWERYDAAVAQAPDHPLPRYYRAQAALLLARLLGEFLGSAPVGEDERAHVVDAVEVLCNRAMRDAEAAASLLEGWGLIPQSYHYRNFHLVPALLAQGTAYQLRGAPGPSASRLQTARRSFPKDDVFFREYLFAKACEQRLDVAYGQLVASDRWHPKR